MDTIRRIIGFIKFVVKSAIIAALAYVFFISLLIIFMALSRM